MVSVLDGGGAAPKTAVTALSTFIVREHVADDPEHAPSHRASTIPAGGVARRTTPVPSSHDDAQLDVQSTPGTSLVIRPPAPDTSVVSVRCG